MGTTGSEEKQSKVLSRIIMPDCMISQESKSGFAFSHLEQIYKECRLQFSAWRCEHGLWQSLQVQSDLLWWVYVEFFSFFFLSFFFFLTSLSLNGVHWFTLLLLTALCKYVQPSEWEGVAKSESFINHHVYMAGEWMRKLVRIA